MKIRTPRMHLMGSSNRDLNTFGQQPKNVFESSYVKSQTGYYKTSQSLPQSEKELSKTNNPYKGTHFQQQTLRWNSKAKKMGSQAEWKLEPSSQRLDYSKYLNQQAGDLTYEFQGKDINMFKLNQLKHTFIKNNRKKRNMNEYFANSSKNGKVGIEEMKKIVREYGYDVTDDEVKVIFKLSGSNENYLGIDQFIELMTKENIHFKTLKLDGAFGKARKHFEEAIHLVFKNKFNQLNEAFRIYRMRGENIDEQKFHYVMKKLDINDLVVSREERQQLFQRFSDKDDKNNKLFNVQKLLCAIVEQEQTLRPTFPPKLSEYQDNLMVNEQNNARKRKKNTYFDFKRISSLQYENQLFKAQEVLREINKIPESSKQIFNKEEVLSKDKVREKVESLLQKKGINFLKEQYDCFISYFDFNANNQISSGQFRQFLLEPTKKAEERFERRTRPLPPQNSKREAGYYDEGTAIQSLLKIKSKKYNPQMRTLFKQFDKDKDGYISREQFKQKIQNLAILQKWQVQNLTNYLDSEGKGFTSFKDFASKFTQGDKQPDNITQSYIKGKSQSEWINTKKCTIKDNNTYTYNMPSKYSAWPQRLKRTDFSMIQPPAKAGQFISEDSRFNVNEKHCLGQQMKQQKYRIYENKLRKLVAWNELNQQRVHSKDMQQQQRSKGNDYLLRITKQTYEQHCHK